MKTIPVAASGGLGESALQEKSRFLQSLGILKMKKRCFDVEIPKQGGKTYEKNTCHRRSHCSPVVFTHPVPGSIRYTLDPGGMEGKRQVTGLDS
jgi:hypothetical protein